MITFFHSLLMSYTKKINHANAAHVQITTSAVYVLYLDSYAFVLIKNCIKYKIYITVYWKISIRLLLKCMYMYMCIYNNVSSV